MILPVLILQGLHLELKLVCVDSCSHPSSSSRLWRNPSRTAQQNHDRPFGTGHEFWSDVSDQDTHSIRSEAIEDDSGQNHRDDEVRSTKKVAQETKYAVPVPKKAEKTRSAGGG
jgi:hypothetical protein